MSRSPQQPLSARHTLPPFDELVALAKNHPDAFEQVKKELCEEMILSASRVMQQRLWAQQSHIDRMISRGKNPDHINVLLMRELCTQMAKFRDALEGDLHQERCAQLIAFPTTSAHDNGQH